MADNNFDFTIVGTSTAFAKYWNKKYPEIYKTGIAVAFKTD